MIIALTGTPGTGKTSVAEKLDYDVLDLTRFVKERDLGARGEEFRVDIQEMNEELGQYLEDRDDVVIEGHLSHHFPADLCIVLRTEPSELEKRLRERDYDEKKVRDNVESERIDLVLQEAVSEQENILEVDTTGRDAEDVAEEIEERIEKKDYGYGEVDWTHTI